MEFLGVGPSMHLVAVVVRRISTASWPPKRRTSAACFLGKPGWNRIPGQRQDYIALLVGERTENVLVEFFPGKFGIRQRYHRLKGRCIHQSPSEHRGHAIDMADHCNPDSRDSRP